MLNPLFVMQIQPSFFKATTRVIPWFVAVALKVKERKLAAAREAAKKAAEKSATVHSTAQKTALSAPVKEEADVETLGPKSIAPRLGRRIIIGQQRGEVSCVLSNFT